MKVMSRPSTRGAIALVLLAIAAHPAWAVPNLRLNVQGPTTVAPGQTLNVTLDVDTILAADAINGVQALIHYDNTVLRLDAIVPTLDISGDGAATADDWTEAVNVDTNGDLNWVGVINAAGVSVFSNHTIMTMQMTAIAEGITTVSFRADNPPQFTKLTRASDNVAIFPNKFDSSSITLTCDDGNACTTDTVVAEVCSNTAVAMGTVCRASAGLCDVAEACDGTTAPCPADGFVMVGTECRAAVGPCDLAESCDGMSAACPSDVVAPMGMVCNASTGPCDPAETCDGVVMTCPANVLSPMGTICNASTGPCDPAEACDGIAASCPADMLSPMGTVCNASTGPCDPAETCDGAVATCPTDVLSPAGTVCNAAAGPCDVDETCDGMVATCPTDAVAPMGTVCNASAGLCDPAETCDGTAITCPADMLSPMGTVCNASAGVCDPAEVCDGTTPTCPADVLEPSTTECRASTDVCDPAEFCDGFVATCPADAFLPDGTTCDDLDVCTENDVCGVGVCAGIDPAPRINLNLVAEALASPVMRDLDIVITTCGGLVENRTVTATFDNTGFATAVLDNVDMNANFMSVREGHTLRKQVVVDLTTGCSDITVTLTAMADMLLTGDLQNLGGTLLQDDIVDINDFSVVASNFTQPINANLSAGADVNGDGMQDILDFMAMQPNFFKVGDAVAACLPGPGGGDGFGFRTSAKTMAGAVKRGMTRIAADSLSTEDARRADLNADGVVDVRDIRAFASKYDLPLLPEFSEKLDLIEEIDRLRDARHGVR